jgi:hypothetical protein
MTNDKFGTAIRPGGLPSRPEQALGDSAALRAALQ